MPLADLVQYGNLDALETSGTGWFIGFGDWLSGDSMRHIAPESKLSNFSAKWFSHLPGDPSGESKPISIGRSMSILINPNGKFRLDFSLGSDFDESKTITVVLQSTGDYVLWGPNLYHRAFGVEASTILTLRWNLHSS